MTTCSRLRYKRKINVFIALLRFFATVSDGSANVSKFIIYHSRLAIRLALI
jgi:hypothetical protein